MKRKEEYTKKIQAQLDVWDADIKKLKAKANQAETNTKLEIQKRIDTLKRKREKTGDKFAELRSASDDAWEDLKDGLEAAKDSLGDALKSATAHFK